MRNTKLRIASELIRKFWSLTLTVICIYILLLISACGESGTRLLYAGSKVGDQVSASYELFTGVDKKTFIADEGDMIVFSYLSSVEKGKLKLEVYSPDDVLITSFTANRTGTREVDIEKTGKHTVQVTGNQTKGRYQVSWKTLN